MTRILLVPLAVGALLLSGCSTLKGAGVGAALGAGTAAVTNNDVGKGAAIGAGAGAVVGTAVGD